MRDKGVVASGELLTGYHEPKQKRTKIAVSGTTRAADSVHPKRPVTIRYAVELAASATHAIRKAPERPRVKKGGTERISS